jgi:hypothetical protein
MAHGAIVQHGQVEAAAVPADQLRHVLLDAAEEGLDDLSLLAHAGRLAVDEAVDAQALGIAENAGDHEHALQVMRHEIALARLGAFGDIARMELGVGERRLVTAVAAQ